MIAVVQGIVILAALGIIMSVFAGRQTHAARAWKKIALLVLAFTMVIAVLFPELTNVAARVVGVGRGADLLLYVLSLAFIGYVVNNYVHQQKDREVVHRLARKLALFEAEPQIRQRKSGR